MLDNLRIGWKLTVITAIMALFVVVVGFVGWSALTSVGQDIRSIYLDRTVPLLQLSNIQAALDRIRARAVLVASADNRADVDRAIGEIGPLDAAIDETWRAYTATFLTDEEKGLVRDFEGGLAKYRAVRDSVISAARAGNQSDAYKIMTEQGAKAFQGAIAPLAQLLELQEREAKKLFDSAETHQEDGLLRFLLITLAAVLVGGAASWVIGSSITKPLSGAVHIMGALTKGTTEVVIEGLGRRDEVGDIARSLAVFRDGIAERQRLVADQAAAKERADADRRHGLNQLASEFEASVSTVVQTVSSAAQQVRSNAQGMAATADQTSRQSMTVASAAEQASVNVHTVAAATEELSGSIQEISRQVTESAKVAGQAVDQARRTNSTVAGLSEAASKIGDVVKLISNIASQTNLLALNATIEAARAGDAGKGFAVVASEVKNLANQTSKATEEIETQINQIQAVSHEAVKAIQEIGSTISRINEIATGIASAVEEQGAATQEIARNIQQASAGTQEVSNTIGAVTRAATETQGMATEVLGAANDLTQQATTLGTAVDGFVRRVRAG